MQRKGTADSQEPAPSDRPSDDTILTKRHEDGSFRTAEKPGMLFVTELLLVSHLVLSIRY